MLAKLQTCRLCDTLLYFSLKKQKNTHGMLNDVGLKTKLFKYFF